MIEKQAEKIGLPVTGMVLGALGLAISWIPLVNIVGFILGVSGLIIIGVSLYVNRQNKKLLTYIGLGLTIAASVISMTLYVTYANVANSVTKVIDSEIQREEQLLEDNKKIRDNADAEKAIKEELGENANMDLTKSADKWTQAYFDNLKVGDSLTGQGGVNMTAVEKEVGKPTITFDVEEAGVKARVHTWADFKDTDSIVLLFVQQANGDWLLAHKSIEKDSDGEV